MTITVYTHVHVHVHFHMHNTHTHTHTHAHSHTHARMHNPHAHTFKDSLPDVLTARQPRWENWLSCETWLMSALYSVQLSHNYESIGGKTDHSNLCYEYSNIP